MWCQNCGVKLPDNARNCPNCGKAVASAGGGFGFSNPGSLNGGASAPAQMQELPTHRPAPVRQTPPVHYGAPVQPAAPVAQPRTVAEKKSFAPKAPVSDGAARRIPFNRELKLLLRQGWLVMLGEKRNMVVSLLFPVLAALATVFVAGERMFETFENTKSGCFVLVCAAIWCGLFNSVQTVVKERENIKRDYVSGALRIECYTLSRAILQMALCFLQSLVLVMAIPVIDWVHGNEYPSYGILFGGPMIEYFISLFLLMFSADTLGLVLSSLVKKPELASQMSPYILIFQLLFSGVLFKLEGFVETLSIFMVSRWGMEALGSISDLNDLPIKVIADEKDDVTRSMLEDLLPGNSDAAFENSVEHLLTVWLILIVFSLVQLLITNLLLRNVKKDTRS